jgi:hypothetical protein
VSEGIARRVDHVLDGLVEADLPESRLSEEWAAVAGADDEEGAFCRAVARLGLDPYAVDDETAADVLHVAGTLPEELVGDFLDNADPRVLRHAADWTRHAVGAATRAASRAPETLQPMYEATSAGSLDLPVNAERPWVTGYRMARSVRQALEVPSVDRFDISPWVGRATSSRSSGGIPGVVAVAQDRCGLFQGNSRTRFGQARALGRALTRPHQHSFILSTARGYDERVAGAFAAELLAPAAGIHQALDALGNRLDDAALDAIAARFDVSPLVIRHQYDNQLAEDSGGVALPT